MYPHEWHTKYIYSILSLSCSPQLKIKISDNIFAIKFTEEVCTIWYNLTNDLANINDVQVHLSSYEIDDDSSFSC